MKTVLLLVLLLPAWAWAQFTPTKEEVVKMVYEVCWDNDLMDTAEVLDVRASSVNLEFPVSNLWDADTCATSWRSEGITEPWLSNVEGFPPGTWPSIEVTFAQPHRFGAVNLTMAPDDTVAVRPSLVILYVRDSPTEDWAMGPQWAFLPAELDSAQTLQLVVAGDDTHRGRYMMLQLFNYRQGGTKLSDLEVYECKGFGGCTE